VFELAAKPVPRRKGRIKLVADRSKGGPDCGRLKPGKGFMDLKEKNWDLHAVTGGGGKSSREGGKSHWVRIQGFAAITRAEKRPSGS